LSTMVLRHCISSIFLSMYKQGCYVAALFVQFESIPQSLRLHYPRSSIRSGSGGQYGSYNPDSIVHFLGSLYNLVKFTPISAICLRRNIQNSEGLFCDY
jgi:hypothetical protein